MAKKKLGMLAQEQLARKTPVEFCNCGHSKAIHHGTGLCFAESCDCVHYERSVAPPTGPSAKPLARQSLCICGHPQYVHSGGHHSNQCVASSCRCDEFRWVGYGKKKLEPSGPPATASNPRWDEEIQRISQASCTAQSNLESEIACATKRLERLRDHEKWFLYTLIRAGNVSKAERARMYEAIDEARTKWE